MTMREVFATNVGYPDRATRKLSEVGIEEPFLLAPTASHLTPIENLALLWRETYPKLKQRLRHKFPRATGAE